MRTPATQGPYIQLTHHVDRGKTVVQTPRLHDVYPPDTLRDGGRPLGGGAGCPDGHAPRAAARRALRSASVIGQRAFAVAQTCRAHRANGGTEPSGSEELVLPRG